MQRLVFKPVKIHAVVAGTSGGDCGSFQGPKGHGRRLRCFVDFFIIGRCCVAVVVWKGPKDFKARHSNF